ncbi:MAG: glycosyltransferase family 4 protein [Acidimicrobiaceae bacterium]|nr:glycosyltransferase family 4 protein [Acidimicrobiaceae bacterium]MXW75492.1 glycosyltransferase family 4 protein [Acidimicrobiaceae bacterium]MYA73923.1 glycosyltransferase family 4 protein [Acidimicrobiaceae bacterium]MYC42232.1 glycosyltransferase family 4 protein [Acidimicrobiaceae bacterium]MYD05926.1 glycosyltransferase family 4 protein [Acidimicrobiaceae bacterium]
MVRHLLVTNDFPPKIGGIQNYLWELWRRLPPDDVVVYSTPHANAAAFDAAQPFTVVRSREPWLLPHPLLARRVDQLASDYDAELVILDPAVPVGLIGPHLKLRYGVVLHGAEVTIPGRIPGVRSLLNRVLGGAVGVIAAGGYPAQQAERSLGRALPVSIIPPGVDTARFVPLDQQSKRAARSELGLPADGPLVVSVSRLVPRKGMDTLIKASVAIRRAHPEVCVAIAGVGRDRRRLSSLIARLDAPVRLLGRVDPDALNLLYGCGDVFTMLCRSRWGGLEQEGFGIVFVEAAAAGTAQVAGRSGGAHEAVVHSETGLIVDNPDDSDCAAAAISQLLDDDERRGAMARASRERAERDFSYDILAPQLATAINTMVRR